MTVPAAVPPFPPLSATPLGLDARALLDAMEPFVVRHVSRSDPAWREEVARKTDKTRRRLRRRRLLGWIGVARRDQRRIEAEYAEAWSRKGFAPYAGDDRSATVMAWQYGDAAMFATAASGSRARLLVLMRAVAFLRPRSVLEVGCGNGVNLLCLAARFPDVRFAGVELTRGGVDVLRGALREPELPAALATFSPEAPADRRAHRRIAVHRGTAARLPFRDGAFDLVYSSLALEQMEEVREDALSEMARVAARHTLMLEPFAESNAAGLPLDYRRARDHFAGAVRDLPRYGLEPVLVTDDLPGEIFLRPCLAICRKRGAA